MHRRRLRRGPPLPAKRALKTARVIIKVTIEGEGVEEITLQEGIAIQTDHMITAQDMTRIAISLEIQHRNTKRPTPSA